MITDDSNDVDDYNDSKQSPCLEHTELLSIGEPELVVRLPGKLNMIMIMIKYTIHIIIIMYSSIHLKRTCYQNLPM